MPQINKEAFDILSLYYKSAQKKITKNINSGTSYKRAQRKQILSQVNSEVQRLEKSLDKWSNKNIQRNYKAGDKEAVILTKSVGLPMKDVQFSNLDNESIQSIAEETMSFFQEGSSGVRRNASRIMSAAREARTNALIAEGRITGSTRKDISNKIAGELRDGNVAIVDKAGRKWSFENYSKMVARTKLTQASNQGLMNRLQRNGYDLVQVSMHFGTCDLCAPWEGRILSISGNTSRFRGGGVPSVDTARKEGLFHPNCRHRLLPYHPEFAEQSLVWSTRNQEYMQGYFSVSGATVKGFKSWLANSQSSFTSPPPAEDVAFDDLRKQAQSSFENKLTRGTRDNAPIYNLVFEHISKNLKGDEQMKALKVLVNAINPDEPSAISVLKTIEALYGIKPSAN